jgi:hypothetical protein
MRIVTVCQNDGPRKVSGADHDRKIDHWTMLPGTAWKLDDERREHSVVPITKAQAGAARYDWQSRHIDGRTVAIFLLDGAEHGQPMSADPRARESRLGSSRKVRQPRRQAPGVAPEAPAAEPAPARSRAVPDDGEAEAGPARGRRPSALVEGPRSHRKRGGPRGGLRLEI